MKKLKQTAGILLWLLFLPLMVTAQLPGDYDPNNPPEPQNLFTLTLQQNIIEAGSVSGGGNYAEGFNKWLYANTNSGYRFLYWKEKDEIISTSSSLYYTMPARTAILTAHWIYDPSHPTEPNVTNPRRKVNFQAEPEGAGYFSSSTYENIAGTNFNCYAYPYSGYKFTGWYSSDTLISAFSPLNFTVRKEDVLIIGKFAFDPGSPGEPNPGNQSLTYLAIATHLVEKNKTMAFPVHLVNLNTNITSLQFIIEFPAGISVDYNNSALSSRQNGHQLSVVDLNNNQFEYSIMAPTSTEHFSGSSGTIVTIPIVLNDDWEAGSSHPVMFTQTTAWSGENYSNIPRKNGALVMQGHVSSLYASYFPDIYLNRVYFSNLSSADADSCLWHFGDGNNSAKKNPLHEYAEPGNYQVMLKVYRGEFSDSVWQTIQIADRSVWKVFGNYSLHHEKSGPRNFHTLPEMFRLFAQANITGDLKVFTQSAQAFSFDFNDNNSVFIDSLQQEMNRKGYKLIFQNDGNESNPLLFFGGELTQKRVDILLSLWKKTTLQAVSLHLLEKIIHIDQLNNMREQYVCSGTNSMSTHFSFISNDISFDWMLDSDNNIWSQGALNTGNHEIPEMNLQNDSTLTDKIVYAVNGHFGDGIRFRLMHYTYHVRPLLKGQISNISPHSGALEQSISVNFSWKAVADAVYDLYVWESGTTIHSTPLLAGLTHNIINNSSYCKYGKSYLWKVIARSHCNTIESHVDSFKIRTLPDLEPIAFRYPEELYSGDPLKVEITVRNNGGNFGNMWMTNELLLARSETLENLHSLKMQSSYVNLNTDSSTTIVFDVVLPTDTVTYTRFVFRLDKNNNVQESNEANNVLVSEPIHIIQPQIDEDDYTIMAEFYRTNGGSYWTNKWRTSTRLMIADNWPGVTFYRGKVTSITLRNNGITGKLPVALFGLTALKSLNLEGNNLTGDFGTLSDALINLNVPTDSLQKLILSQNQFTGEISDFAKRFPRLYHLNLSKNQSLTLREALPDHIKELYLQNIELPVDTLVLSQTPTLRLASLMKYNHATKAFDHNPGFNVYDLNRHIGYLWFTSGIYRMHWYASEGWDLASGKTITLHQNSGVAYGTRMPVVTIFTHGDANVDQAVDVLDVQHTLNHVLRESPKPFNFIAADTYPDQLMTVQDIVATINIILEDTLETTAPGGPLKMFSDSPANTLSMDGTWLRLEATDAIAALDITLRNVKANQLRLMLNNSNFQLIANDLPDGVRLIIFSVNGSVIKTGVTRLMEVATLAAEIVAVTCSDRQAQPLTSRIVHLPTQAHLLMSDDLSVRYYRDEIIVLSKSEISKLQLYNVQGMLLKSQKNISTHSEYCMATGGLPEGVYLLRLQLIDRSERTIRLIISN